MVRSVAALLAGFAFVAAAHAANTYHDPEGRFSVDIPANWTAVKPENRDKINLVMVGMQADSKTPLGACVFGVHAMPETTSATQAQMDAALDEVFTDNFWKESLQEAGGADVSVLSTGTREQNGRKIHFAVATLSETTKDGVSKSKGKQEMQGVPGSLHLVACVTDPELYDTALADFDTIFKSYQPKSGLVSQAPSKGTSVLTFYAGPNASGPARAVAQDTANVPALGFEAQTVSLAVTGSGTWEACEGVNFTGACHALGTAETADVGESLRIGSVRRLASKPQGAARAIRAEAAGAFKSAAERLHQGR